MMRLSRLCLTAAIVGAVTFVGVFAARAQLDGYVQELIIRSNPEIDEDMIRRLRALDICIGYSVSRSTECKVFRGLRNAQWAGLVIALAGAGGFVATRRRQPPGS